MKKFLLYMVLISSSVFAEVEIKKLPHSISAERNEKVLWTYNHDPAEGKPYFHPLAPPDGTAFTDLRPEDHPWHRGVWFSWKYINGVNYWEEDRQTGKSEGETRIVDVDRTVTAGQAVHLKLKLEYAPSGSDEVIMREHRAITISPSDPSGAYTIDWTSDFQALEKEVVLDRTPLPGEPNGKSWGGYAGWSVRMNKDMIDGTFLNSENQTNASRKAARWTLFKSPEGGSLLFMDHPANRNHPAKWYLAPGMPYFSPAVIHDGPHTIADGETLTLRYRLVVSQKPLTAQAANGQWDNWTKSRVVILSGANNHNWQQTTPALEQILEDSGKFEVNVVHNPEQLTTEFLADYDVLLSNWNAFGKNKPAPWSNELKKAYVDFVRNGGGHVAVHAGSSSFYDWNEYQTICLATWKDGTGHKKPHEFEVRFADRTHPVTAGLQNFQITDELWFKPFVHPEASVLSESYSQHTGKWEPTAFAGHFGKGRCFTLLLGHSATFMQNKGFEALLTAGTEWAGKLK
ncbi:PmoA family protein [Pontiellaceae bacterium B12227]|nr:PmoA family protein [Pontiellaceae bacterium B12227]